MANSETVKNRNLEMIGDQFHKACKHYGFTQEEVAELLGISVTTLRDIMYGRRELKQSELAILMKYFKFTSALFIPDVPDDLEHRLSGMLLKKLAKHKSSNSQNGAVNENLNLKLERLTGEIINLDIDGLKEMIIAHMELAIKFLKQDKEN